MVLNSASKSRFPPFLFFLHFFLLHYFQINCLVMLFCVALSTGWTSRLAAIIGLIFNLISLLFAGGAIATLFAWNLADMSLPKVSGILYLHYDKLIV